MRCFKEEGGNISFKGRSIQRRHLITNKRRICPDCLSYSQYSKRCWDLAVVHICPDHKLRLVDKCHGCEKAISWNTPRISHCACGYNFQDSIRTHAEEAYIEATALLISKFEEGDGANCAEPVRHLSFSSLVEFLLVLYAGVHELEMKGKRAIRLNDENLFQLLQQGLEVSYHWPARFHELLTALRSNEESRHGVYGMSKAFGRMHHAIAEIEDHSVREIVHESFREYVRDNGDIGLTTRHSVILNSEDRILASHMTTKEAAAQLNISPGKVGRLVKAGLLTQPSESRGRGKPTLITGESVRNYAERSHFFVNQTTALAELSVSRGILNELVDRGVIKRFGTTTRHSTPWLVDRGDIAELIKRLENTCRTPRRHVKALVSLTAIFGGQSAAFLV